MERQQNVFAILFTYPFTWAVIGILALCEGVFFWWFAPSGLMKIIVVAAGGVLLTAWPLIFLRSATFRQLAHQQPYKSNLQTLAATLKSCAPAFAKPARECLALLERTQQEFQSQTFQGELDRIFENLHNLSQNHAQLYTRVQKFGTVEQKRTMQRLIQQQVQSVENTLNSLKAFSGNLTLLDTNPNDYEQMGNDLKAINDELQHVIQEV